MSDFTHNDSALIGGEPTSSVGFAPAIRALWHWLSAPVQALVDRERLARELASLGDRDLADIGLSRSDIPAVLAGWRGRDGLSQRKLDPGA